MRLAQLFLFAALLVTACGSDGSADSLTDAGADSPLDTQGQDVPHDAAPEVEPDVQDTGPPACGTGNRPMPGGLVELAWDDGEPVASLREQSWSIELDGTSYVLNEQVLWEAVRFELEHPARIHGFSVQWAGLPDGAPPGLELSAGLYPDFGYNGFDFWQPDPLWEGTRCAEDVAEGSWIDYVFASPIEVEHPGLVYVAHRIDDPTTPVFPFDGTTNGAGECATFDECHGSMNFPEIDPGSSYNGLTIQFQYDYLVRLRVEYLDDVTPAEKLFQPKPFDGAGHVSFGDYDNDGWDDLIVSGPRLYHNEGAGEFADVTDSAGIAAMGISGTGGVFGDYDNDGCLDLFVFSESTTASDALLRSNCDGTFADVTAAAGIVDEQSYNDCGGDPANVRSPTAAAAWADLDADGFLDLYLANFICWAQETYYVDTVFHNLGNGTFESWTSTHGFTSSKMPSRGVSPIDHDDDGDIDLFVNNYRLRANQFFENQGDGTFIERAYPLGLAGRNKGLYFGHTIGAAWGDLDNDGDFDLIQANLAHPRFFDFSSKTEVLLQVSPDSYVDIAGDWKTPASNAGLRYQETHSVPALADFDQDGNLDLIITCVYDGRPTDFYWGNGDGTFRLDAYHAGITTENGWGLAISDVDNDGDPDAFVDVPFVNTMNAGDKGHWLQVRAIGNVDANWSAIGAVVRVTAGGTTRLRQVQGGTGKGGQDSQYLHFGLGDEAQVSAIEVTFPGGKAVSYAGPFVADQRIWVFEDGTTHLGWTPP